MNDIASAIDRKISVYCVVHKMSQDSFAKLMDMTTNTLRSKRRGFTDWTISELVQLCDLIGETPNSLTEWK